jgi:hypothetical protein
VSGLPAPADQRRSLEPVHPRHVDVEQDERELPLEHLAQRFVAGRRRMQVLAQLLEHRAVDEQLVRPVVDDQDAGPIGHRRDVLIRAVVQRAARLAGIFHRSLRQHGRDSQPRRHPSINSVSTGFDR